MTRTVASAERVIDAPLDAVWALVTDPSQHHRFDGTGMVGSLSGRRPTAVGDVFRMTMTWADGTTVEHYQSDNHVVRYEPPRAIAWATALPDEPPLGWTWTYELADDAGGTWVRLTYDWTNASPQNVSRFGVPLTDEAGLAVSLAQLAKACDLR